ncbi:MAG: NAD-dependent epimerase/dehydratase family protein [Planctomycetota bacterium]|nr:NAD-dependent epimerase/dehydratase family protein [Planctomycetota bacterium]
MRALITGGHGFIGSHLVRLLLEAGTAVRCLSRHAERPQALAGLDVEVVKGDLRARAGLDQAVRGVDEVYHLAGLTSSLTQSVMQATNADGTARLIEAAARADLAGRFVYCSSLSVMGPGPCRTEADPPQPVSWYGASKWAGEQAVLARAPEVPVTVLRPPGVYGPRDVAWLPLFRSAARGVSLLAGRPGTAYSLIHAADLARALHQAARHEATRGGVYFAAHPEIVTLEAIVAAAEAAVDRRTLRLGVPPSAMRLIGSLVDLAAQWTGRSSVLGRQRMLEVATGDWVCAPDALMRATGWAPTIGHRAGFRETAAWYRAQGLLA